MSELLDRTEKILERCRLLLARHAWAADDHTRLVELVASLKKPCLIAITGQARTGKSRFVNTLLGEDIAPVGETETTATQTRFVYGSPEEHKRVRCHWHSGNVTDVHWEFLKSMQGTDHEVMARAREIGWFEGSLNNPWLRNDVVLVDTPGINAVIEEHQKAAEKAVLQQAAAIVYLTRYVVGETDTSMVDAFQRLAPTDMSAMNALGVMSQIDRSPEAVVRRTELAGKVERTMAGKLVCVIPISSALQEAIQDEAKIFKLQQQLLKMPYLDEALESREFFFDDELGAPFSVAEREEMLGGCLWTAFRLIAKELTIPGRSAGEARRILLDYAGFERLHAVLKDQFLGRAEIFKCCHALTHARVIMDTILRDKLDKQKALLKNHASAIEKVRSAIKELPVELQFGLGSLFDVDDSRSEIEKALEDLDWALNEQRTSTNEFRALKLLHDNHGILSEQEVDELCCVLGERGTTSAKRLAVLNGQSIQQRQLYWQRVEKSARRPLSEIARAAVTRYSLLRRE